MSYFIHDVVDELIEIKNRADLLRSFLQFLQTLHLALELRVSRGEFAEDICWCGAHKRAFKDDDTDWMLEGNAKTRSFGRAGWLHWPAGAGA